MRILLMILVALVFGSAPAAGQGWLERLESAADSLQSDISEVVTELSGQTAVGREVTADDLPFDLSVVMQDMEVGQVKSVVEVSAGRYRIVGRDRELFVLTSAEGSVEVYDVEIGHSMPELTPVDRESQTLPPMLIEAAIHRLDELESTTDSVERVLQPALSDLRANDLDFAPRDAFESDQQYEARTRRAAAKERQLRTSALASQCSERAGLLNGVYMVGDHEMVLGSYDPNRRIYEIGIVTNRGRDTAIAEARVENARARELHQRQSSVETVAIGYIGVNQEVRPLQLRVFDQGESRPLKVNYPAYQLVREGLFPNASIVTLPHGGYAVGQARTHVGAILDNAGKMRRAMGRDPEFDVRSPSWHARVSVLEGGETTQIGQRIYDVSEGRAISSTNAVRNPSNTLEARLLATGIDDDWYDELRVTELNSGRVYRIDLDEEGWSSINADEVVGPVWNSSGDAVAIMGSGLTPRRYDNGHVLKIYRYSQGLQQEVQLADWDDGNKTYLEAKFSPNDRYLVIAEDEEWLIVSLSGGRIVRLPRNDLARNIAFNTQSDLVALGGKVLTLPEGREYLDLSQYVDGLAFSHDDRFVVGVSESGKQIVFYPTLQGVDIHCQ